MSGANAIALSGIKTLNKEAEVIAGNIARARVPGAAAQQVEVVTDIAGGMSQGVKIAGISRFYDKFLTSSIVSAQTDQSSAQAITDFFKAIDEAIGDRESPRNPSIAVQNFFQSIQRLSNENQNPALKSDVVNQASNLSEVISGLATKLEELRLQADLEIKESVNKVNDITTKIRSLNGNLAGSTGSDTQVNFIEERDRLIEDLAKYIDVRVSYLQDEQAIITTASGAPLVSTGNSELRYNNALTINDFTSKTSLSPLQAVSMDPSGRDFRVEELISGGVDYIDINKKISGGKIWGLSEVRDKEIPRILETLNNFAEQMVTNVNKIHNKGTGYPPLGSYKAAKVGSLNEVMNWSGSMRVAVLDSKGKPAKVGNSDSVIKPLELNLAKLDSGSGVGRPDMQTVIDEINQYFLQSSVSNSFSFGKSPENEDAYLIKNVELAATRDITTQPDGTFEFDLQLENSSQFDADFEVLDVIVRDTDGNILPNALISDLPPKYKLESGKWERTGQKIEVDFAGGAGNGPYEIEVKMRTSGDNGVSEEGSISYVIDDDPDNPAIRNNRYVGSSFSGAVVSNPPTSILGVAEAKFVDANGVNIPRGSNKEGYLVIETRSDNYRVALDDMNSQDLGIPGLKQASDKGFFHYYGLNNLFAEDYTGKNHAFEMKLREDILSHPSRFSVASLAEAPQKFDRYTVNAANSRGSISFDVTGPLPGDGDILNVNGSEFTFRTVGPVAENEILVGGNWNDTIDNIMTQISAENNFTAGKADLATYQYDGISSIGVEFKEAGFGGNNFNINTDFTISGNNALNSINNKRFAEVHNGNLDGGAEENIVDYQSNFAMQVGVASNQILNELSNLANKNLSFGAAGGLQATNISLLGYSGNFVSFTLAKFNQASQNSTNNSLKLEGLQDKHRSQGGINIDKEMTDMIKLQHIYSANAKVIETSNKLFETLLSIM